MEKFKDFDEAAWAELYAPTEKERVAGAKAAAIFKEAACHIAQSPSQKEALEDFLKRQENSKTPCVRDFEIGMYIPTDLQLARYNSLFEKEKEQKILEKVVVKKVLAVKEVLASCGHYCQPAVLMTASFGTSCPDCYDRMS